MSLEVEATYQNGVLKLDAPLPLKDNERVRVSVRAASHAAQGDIRQSAGSVAWNGDEQALDHLLGPENEPHER